MEKLLTLQEVCSILGSDDPKGRYVRNLRDKGVLECARIGRRLMFKESSVERFIEDQFRKQNVKKDGVTNPIQETTLTTQRQ